MVYVTHDQTEAMTMADQVILMRNGRIEQDAPPADLYARPETAFCARFIGTPPMNILALADGPNGAVVRGGDGTSVLTGAATGCCWASARKIFSLAAAVWARASRRSSISAPISIIAAAIGDQKLSVRVAGRALLDTGARIQIAWPAAKQHLFDAATSRRVDGTAHRPAFATQTQI